MDAFGLVTCNGEQTFNKHVVIGKGQQFNVLARWAYKFPLDSNFDLTFYPADDEVAINDLGDSKFPFAALGGFHDWS
jgi:hypothetical protein